MSRRRTILKKRRPRSQRKSSFLRWLIVGLLIGGGVWAWQKRDRWPWFSDKNKDKPKSEAAERKNQAASGPKAPADPKPVETLPKPEKIAPLTQLFPAKVWEDDYHSINFPKSSLELISLGVRRGNQGDGQKMNPSHLQPFLLLAKKQAGLNYQKEGEFDFEISLPTEAGIGLNALGGLPRITPQSFADLDGDQVPEILVTFDTKGGEAEAVGVLKLRENRLEWVKTKDGNTEKIALWLQGTASAESQELTWIKSDSEPAKLLQKIGKSDPAHPEKGFVWKKVIWKWEGGVLKKQK